MSTNQSHKYFRLTLISPNVSLALLDILKPIPDASHTRDLTTAPPNSECYPHTRRPVIDGIKTWVQTPISKDSGCHVRWLYGFVGCGKSAIAQTVAREVAEGGGLAGSFFFFRVGGPRSRIARLPETLAYQLSLSVPATVPFIRRTVETDGTLLVPGSHCLQLRMRRLVYEPFRDAVVSSVQDCWLIVIDGLDECVDHDQVKEFISGLLEFFKKNPTMPLRFLITSRVEEHIYRHLQSDSVCLEDLADHGSSEDIKHFLCMFFENEVKTKLVTRTYGKWPTEDQVRQLVKRVDGSFIFASTFAKYILGDIDNDLRLAGSALSNVQRQGDGRTPRERLEQVLGINPGLDDLYSEILSRAEHLPYFPHIMITLRAAKRGWSIQDFARHLSCETDQIINVLVNLQAIIQVPGTDDSPVTFFHRSLRDFLQEDRRAGRFSQDSLTRQLLTRIKDFPYFTETLNTYVFWDDLERKVESGVVDGADVQDMKRVLNGLFPFTGKWTFPGCDLTDFLTNPRRARQFHVSVEGLCVEVLSREQDPRFFEVFRTLLILPPHHRTLERVSVQSGVDQATVQDFAQRLMPIAYFPEHATAASKVTLTRWNADEYMLKSESFRQFYPSLDSWCGETLALVSNLPHHEDVISSFVFGQWKRYGILPLRVLCSMVSLPKNPVKEALRGLRPFVLMDENAEYAVLEYPPFVDLLLNGEHSQHVRASVDVFITRRLTQLQEIQVPYIMEVIAGLVVRVGSPDAATPTALARSLELEPSTVLNALVGLFPFCSQPARLCPLHGLDYAFKCSKEFLRFVVDGDRAGRFVIVLSEDQRETLKQVLQSGVTANDPRHPYVWSHHHVARQGVPS